MGAAVPITMILIAAAQGIQANQVAKADEGRSNAAKDEQARQSHATEQKLLQKPVAVAPDNFLANKNKMLTNMRLGLASTITGASSAPAPVLSSPALSAAGTGKKTLGS